MSDNKEIHYRYAIAFLVLAIILVVSLAYYDVPDLVDKLSFALTLSSILLALLAIFYTIVSSSKQEQQLSNIASASGHLSSSVADLERIHSALSTIKNDIPEHFDSMAIKIDKITNYYSKISDNKVADLHEKGAGSFLRDSILRIPFTSMISLYLFSQSFLKDHKIKEEDFGSLTGIESLYALGVFAGFSATGLISFTVYEQAVIPKACDERIMSELRGIIEEVVEFVDEKSADMLRRGLQEVDGIVNSEASQATAEVEG